MVAPLLELGSKISETDLRNKLTQRQKTPREMAIPMVSAHAP